MSGKKTSTSSSLTRPPIVTLMGHIDHGKTTLLDKIRNTRTWYKESKGITQHTLACQAQIPQKNGPPRTITFIDTPGHAAFCGMRSRGAQITDIIVLVIDAKEGIKPQTKECLKLIQKDDTPFLVAINKMDLEGVTTDKVNSELVSEGFNPEAYGGQLATIPLSAKSGEGIDQLLEMILLNADLLDLKTNPDADPDGVIVESFFDSSSGPLATLILKNGRLKVGQEIYIGFHKTKIKALRDETGQNIKVAFPSQPVQVLGFSSPPPVGERISLHSLSISAVQVESASPLPLKKEEEKKIPVLIKADTQGTLEALTQSLSDNVEILSASIGDLTETDLLLAQTAGAQIFIFRAKIPSVVKKLAQHESVKLFHSDTIYEILEELEKQVLKMLEPTIDEEITGQASIIAEFLINKERIAGCRVEKGLLRKGDQIHLKRGENLIKNTTIYSLRQGKENVAQVKAGNDCGLVFKPYIDFKKKDVIMSYIKKIED